MSKEPEIVQAVAKYCWSDRFLTIFRNFFRDRASIFAESDSGYKFTSNLSTCRPITSSAIHLLTIGCTCVHDCASSKVAEHDLAYYDVFQEYLQLYESTIEEFIQDTGYTVEEFYQAVRDAQQTDEDQDDAYFIECLLSSADYESFYRVMVREAKRQAQLQVRLLSVKALTHDVQRNHSA